MYDLKPGTHCFLVGLVDFPPLTGRVVEVVGAVPTPDDESGPWYATRAGWAAEVFPGSDMIAPRRCLRPITPPDSTPAPTAAAKNKQCQAPA